MSPEERELLNEETMLDAGPERVFCGLKLGTLSMRRQKYCQRILYRLGAIGASPSEIPFALAYLYALPMEEVPARCRDFAFFEEGLDEWIEKLPNPIPKEELEKFVSLLEHDKKAIEAADFDVVSEGGKKKPENF